MNTIPKAALTYIVVGPIVIHFFKNPAATGGPV